MRNEPYIFLKETLLLTIAILTIAIVVHKPMEEMLYEFMEGTITADEEGHLQVSER